MLFSNVPMPFTIVVLCHTRGALKFTEWWYCTAVIEIMPMLTLSGSKYDPLAAHTCLLNHSTVGTTSGRLLWNLPEFAHFSGFEMGLLGSLAPFSGKSHGCESKF